MSTNEILIIIFLFASLISKIFIFTIEIKFKYKILENLSVVAICCDFLVITMVCDYIFKWGWFFK